MYSRLEARAASYKSTALFASRGRTSAKFLESQFFWTFLAGPGTQGPGGTVLCDLPRHLRAGTRAGTGCNRHQDRTLKGGHETLRWGMVIPTLWPLLQRMGSPEMWLGCKTTVWKTDIFNEAVLDPPPLPSPRHLLHHPATSTHHSLQYYISPSVQLHLGLACSSR